jgi:hypothetical protein
MNPLTGNWKKLLFVISAGLVLLFASKHPVGGQAAAAAETAQPAAAQVVPDDGPSNEISEFQQLD